MSVNLITGYAGEAHVTSQDDGAVNAGVIGNGKYVFNVGEEFAYETISNNLIRIKDGYMINQGRKIGIKVNDYEDVTIDNGLQSVKRSDLIVMRYTKNADTGIETAEVVVIKGTSGDDYVTPEYTVGDIIAGDLIDDFPLYCVNLDGLTITSVTALFTIFKTYAEVSDEVDYLKPLETFEDLNNNSYGGKVIDSLLVKTINNNMWNKLGKNLLKHSSFYNTTGSNIFTVNEDYSITANGTGGLAGMYSSITFASAIALKPGKYKVSGCPSGGSMTTFNMSVVGIAVDNGDGAYFTIEAETTVQIRISVGVGVVVSNLIFYPMITYAEITDSTYEQYYPTLKEVGTKLGTTDISAIADGTVTGGISAIDSAINTIHSVTSTVGTVTGGYTVIGRTVTVSIGILLTSDVIANSTNIITGLPAPVIIYSPLSGYNASSNLAILPYVTSTYIRSTSAIASGKTIEFSGSYIKA